MQILTITGYKFISLTELPSLRERLLAKCESLALKGTILLSSEGINISISGTEDSILFFIDFLRSNPHLENIHFRESFSLTQPFKYMKVKLRKEIITFRRPEVQPEKESAPYISPQTLKQWLDEKREVMLLDTRNDYEVRFGTFRGAKNLNIDDFCKFPEAIRPIDSSKPIVMFCTGGIRCEKAALYLLSAGFKDVFQLQGGILNYFSEVGGAHYEGECFVFDHRVAVNNNLEATGTLQCHSCQGPIKEEFGMNCPTCI